MSRRFLEGLSYTLVLGAVLNACSQSYLASGDSRLGDGHPPDAEVRADAAVPTDAAVRTDVQKQPDAAVLGIGSFAWYSWPTPTTNPGDLPINGIDYSKKLTWRVCNFQETLAAERKYSPPDGKIIFQLYEDVTVASVVYNSDDRPIANIDWILSRFEQANKHASLYDYGDILLMEELFKATVNHAWTRWDGKANVSRNPWSYFTVDERNLDLSAHVGKPLTIKWLKNWYSDNYGAATFTDWWSRITTNAAMPSPPNAAYGTGIGDSNSILIAWSDYSYGELALAWKLFMDRIGKKAAYVGPASHHSATYIGQAAVNTINASFDLLIFYNYFYEQTGDFTKPYDQLMAKLDAAEAGWVKLRAAFGGKIIYIISPRWNSGDTAFNEEFSYQEFARAAKYATAIIGMGCMDFGVGSCPSVIPWLVGFKERLQ